MKSVGFLGLGLMGLPMAINIINKMGIEVKGYDVVLDKMDAFKEAGGTPVKDPVDIFTSCEIILTCLPTHEIIIDMIEKAIENGKPGNIIVDLSSTAPHIVKMLCEKAEAAGIYLLDSPISGGDVGAQKGTLAIMTGGNKEVFDEVKPILDCTGVPVYVGGSTAGSITKLANNMISGAMIASYAEAYAFAAKAGLDPKKLFEATKAGFIGGPLYENKIPRIYNRDYEPGARLAVHRKDVINAKKFAHELGIDVPMTDITLRIMDWGSDNGYMDIDNIGIIKYFEEKMDVRVEKKS